METENEQQRDNLETKNQEQIDDQGTGTQKPEKIYDLQERLLAFARRIILMSKELPRIADYDGPRRQLINAATSVGANFEEADGALTKKDFINKLSISRKEAKETRYWLKVINGICSGERELTREIKEVEEIICILSSMLIKLGARKYR
ncbi:MAG: four helix bundle protein [Candidatus Margulisbacteria bacterium]|nr:four helix bundle protein [Candidatus Margulisiibacteriota bacterium]